MPAKACTEVEEPPGAASPQVCTCPPESTAANANPFRTIYDGEDSSFSIMGLKEGAAVALTVGITVGVTIGTTKGSSDASAVDSADGWFIGRRI